MAQEGTGWEPVAGNHPPTAHFPAASTSGVSAGNENPVINIRDQIFGKQVSHEQICKPGKHSKEGDGVLVRMQSEEDSSANVVDMHRTTHAPANHAGLGMGEVGIGYAGTGQPVMKLKKHIALRDVPDVLQPSVQQRGNVINGDENDLCKLLDKLHTQADQGVICNSQVLCSDNGVYEEKKQYVTCGKTMKGAFGEVTVCMDQKSHKTIIRKRVLGTVEKNEVLVPFMFEDIPGIPKVFGVIQRGPTTEIFQENAGLSLDKVMTMKEYAPCLGHPGLLLCLAFQAFRTLEKLHSKGIQHLDIKPQNICVDLGQKVPAFKLIDLGSCQMPGEKSTGGVTNEYLSPESCFALVKDQRLEEGTDVWAMGLSLLYCVYGFHPMIYVSTKQFDYHGTRSEREEKRRQCLLTICGLKDEDMAGLLNPPWPCVLKEPVVGREASFLKELFRRALRVDPRQRCSAGQAAAFILHHMMGADMGAPKPMVSASDSPVAGTSGIRLRVPTSQKSSESRQPFPCAVLAPPQVDLPHRGDPTPASQNRVPQTLPCKRKRDGDGESALHCGKVMKK